MEIGFSGVVWHWRGPAPYYFVTVPEEQCDELGQVARAATYGWGCLPVESVLGETRWTTSLIPKDGGYLLPLKVAVRRAEEVDLDDVVDVRVRVQER